MEEQLIYDNIFNDSIQDIENGRNGTDSMLLTLDKDNRRGITLRICPNDEIKERIVNYQNELKKIDNRQYYQPEDDIHLTVMAIIACTENFKLESIAIPAYNTIIQNSLTDIPSPQLYFKGVTTSPSAILLQGFNKNESLSKMRKILRASFKESDLHHSIDSRYEIQTAHMTIVRFIHPLKSPGAYAEVIKKHRLFDFGELKPKEIEFVFNDWYHTSSTINKINTFNI